MGRYLRALPKIAILSFEAVSLVRWLSMFTPKTCSDSTLVSWMPSTERSKACFGEFAIFCLVEIVWYFVFAGCIFILFSFAHFDAASMSGLMFSSSQLRSAQMHRGSSHRHKCQCCSSVLIKADLLWRPEKGQGQEYFPEVHRIEYRAVQEFTVDTYLLIPSAELFLFIVIGQML